MAVNPQEHEAIFAERSVKIICIGAGASGLLLAYKLSRHFDNYNLTVRLLPNRTPGYALTTSDLRQERRYRRYMA
jgi:2-polyprenyl-6-methoxyphenol hydroxylase-like FAD-dependent oxidoreductase